MKTKVSRVSNLGLVSCLVGWLVDRSNYAVGSTSLARSGLFPSYTILPSHGEPELGIKSLMHVTDRCRGSVPLQVLCLLDSSESLFSGWCTLVVLVHHS